MATKTIDLGSKPKTPSATMVQDKVSKVYYPSFYISGVSGASFPLGKISFTATGEVVSCKKDGCEIEIQSITPTSAPKKDAGEGLDEALNGIEADKEDASDEGDSNETDEGE